MLRYLFEKGFTSDDFWNHIENYFLGDLPEEVVERINTKKQIPTNL
jgi:ATP-dependent DNA helicase RecQ